MQMSRSLAFAAVACLGGVLLALGLGACGERAGSSPTSTSTPTAPAQPTSTLTPTSNPVPTLSLPTPSSAPPTSTTAPTETLEPPTLGSTVALNDTGAVAIVQSSASSASLEEIARPLQPGDIAPAFSLHGGAGDTVALEEVLEGHDAVVLVFYRGFF